MRTIRAKRTNWDMLLFFILISAAALGNGMSDSVYSNYFKEAYHVTATQRALIEVPRELPGLLCALIIASLSMLGDIKISVIAQVLSCLGLMVLGLFSPTYGVMLIFLFINSMGMHLFLPLSDSIGMALAEPGHVGRRFGQYASLKMVFGFLAGLLVFFGFRLGWFSFRAPVNLLFLLGAGAFGIAVVAAALLLKRETALKPVRSRTRLVFRRRYRFFYLLTMLHGVQKQVANVFGAWVIVDLLLKGADIMSLLLITVSFISIFFMRAIGRWIDRFGIKRMMYVDALTFIGIYTVYGFVVWGITAKVLPGAGWPVLTVYALFVLDRLSMQIGVVKSLYLKQIAVTAEEITSVLSTGISLDHVVSILAAQLSGFIWMIWGPQWVFFLAAFFSLGNLIIAWRIPKEPGKEAPEGKDAAQVLR
ncbi:MAG: MFS transporter [Eubacteriales bacterium]|mgnify:CR=1 FL=1|jgi:MFS family permease|nr:MFS transporter [Eubacteriales bacterium]MDD3573326.1 MFS transporter [Eubacteriales bacterium]MDD4134398.1 MFS transporter [Eubacteriales bacterium]NLO13666.1 MFS transporter [Clostridiales bacterium]